METTTSIIVVNWNTPGLLSRCVDEVRCHTRAKYELILVDNGSTDASPGLIQRYQQQPDTRAVLLPENLGFAGGYNRGIQQATGETICLLNSDAFVTSGWLASMLTRMRCTGAGMVGPCTNRAKGKQRRKLWFGRFPPVLRRSRRVAYLSFFCVLIKRQVFEQIGLLDERFGLGMFEDDDFCVRARHAGFSLVIDGRAWVWHEAHGSFDANALDTDHLYKKNAQLFREKWG